MDEQTGISDEDRLIVDALDPPRPLPNYFDVLVETWTKKIERNHQLLGLLEQGGRIQYNTSPFLQSPLAHLLSFSPAENSTPTSPKQ